MGLKISAFVSPEVVYFKRKGKMADDNVSAVMSHKMALDKEKAGFTLTFPLNTCGKVKVTDPR